MVPQDCHVIRKFIQKLSNAEKVSWLGENLEIGD